MPENTKRKRDRTAAMVASSSKRARAALDADADDDAGAVSSSDEAKFAEAAAKESTQPGGRARSSSVDGDLVISLGPVCPLPGFEAAVTAAATPPKPSRKSKKKHAKEAPVDTLPVEELSEDVIAKVHKGVDRAKASGQTLEGLQFHSSVTVHDHCFRIGDYVHVISEYNGTEQRNVGEILAISTPPTETDSAGNVTVLWLYAPEETHTGRLLTHLPNEVFYTNHVDTFCLEALDGKCDVVDEKTFQQRLENLGKSQLKDTYVCRYFYDHLTSLTRSFDITAALVERAKPAIPQSEAEKAVSRAIHALKLSTAVTQLPCRSQQRKDITDFIKTSLKAGGPGSALYVTGMPGTGKTALVTEIVKTLQAGALERSNPTFTYIDINAMKLASANDLYTQLVQRMFNVYASNTKAAQMLDHAFRSKNQRPYIVLLVDEIDFLVTKSQTVMYNLLDWPQQPHSRLIVICISNTMDLPERLLPKVASRLSASRLVFEPYTAPQLQEIAATRLKSAKADGLFEEEALKHASLTVSGLTGDVRRLLQILRKSIDIAIQRAKATADASAPILVGIPEIKQARKTLFENITILAIRSAAPWEKLLLMALYIKQVRSKPVTIFSLEELQDSITSLLTTAGITAASIDPSKPTDSVPYDGTPSLADLHVVTVQLHRQRLVNMYPTRDKLYPNVRLLPSVEDVQMALMDDPVGSKVLSS